MKTFSTSDKNPILARLRRVLSVIPLVLSAFGVQAKVVLTTLHSFAVLTNGANPGGLVQGRDGNFYGTTDGGGTNGAYGSVFKISASGAVTSLYSFTGRDGANPEAGLIQGSDGYFYGTTTEGLDEISTNGALNSGAYGTVFKISAHGAFTSLYTFTNVTNGGHPAALVQGRDGYFYGTTSDGGTYGNGTVFKISASGAFTSLYSFTGGNDGATPAAALVQGTAFCSRSNGSRLLLFVNFVCFCAFSVLSVCSCSNSSAAAPRESSKKPLVISTKSRYYIYGP